MSNMETIIEQMKKISLSEDPLPLLVDMKSNLIAMSNREVSEKFESEYSLSYIHPLFDVLNSSSKEQIIMCVDVLNYILSKINPKTSLENLTSQYLLCLNHPHEKVRLLVLKQILICSENTEAAQTLVRQRSLFTSVLKCLGDENMEISTMSHKILLALSKTLYREMNLIFTPHTFETLTSIMGLSDSVRFRVYDVIVKISCISQELLEVMVSSRILIKLISESFSGDILTQLNALELLSELAATPHGLQYLKREGIVGKISYLLFASKNDQMAAVLLPGLLKFFGHLGAQYPNILAEEEVLSLQEILKISCDFSGQTEPTIQLIAFETLAHIGATTEGKNTLKKFNVEMEQSLKDLSSHFTSFPLEMKVRVIEALSELFFLPSEYQTEDLVHLLETWFNHLSSSTSSINLFLGVARQPFPELLKACLALFQSFALLPWGLQRMASEPGFMEWLLDRDACKDKETKEARYGIIATIYKHDAATKSILDEGIQRSIETFYNQGPFYVETELNVAFERET